MSNLFSGVSKKIMVADKIFLEYKLMKSPDFIKK